MNNIKETEDVILGDPQIIERYVGFTRIQTFVSKIKA